jgi:hypothetical protein
MTLILTLILTVSCPENDAVCQLNSFQVAAHSVDKTKLEEIYQRAEFSRAKQKPNTWAHDMFVRIDAWLSSIFETRGADVYAKFTRVFVLAFSMGIALFFLLKFARFKMKRERNKSIPQIPKSTLLPPQQHLKRAYALLETDARAALNQGLLALLSSLEQKGFAQLERTKTNVEISDELPQRGASTSVAVSTSEKLKWHDRVWYSQSKVNANEVRDFLNSVEGIR